MSESPKKQKYPWWEPYVFTAVLLLGFAVAFIALGFAASIPYFLPCIFAVATAGALWDAVRNPPKLVIDKAFTACFLVLMGFGAFFVATKFLSLAYFGMAMAWFGLAIHAATVQRRIKLLWPIGLLASAACILFVYLSFVNPPKVLADVTSPSGAWRMVVHGKAVLGGVEVTATVHTSDDRSISCGVIDLRPEWPEAEFVYQAHKTLHTRIDEVKAIVGDRLFFRDDYFPDEKFGVTGTLADKQVTLRIGKVDDLGFHFESGITDTEKVSVQVANVRETLDSAEGIAIDSSKDQFAMPGINYIWRDPESGQLNVVGHHKDFSLRLKVDKVSDFVVTGTVRLVGNAPEVNLAGEFRIVNALNEH